MITKPENESWFEFMDRAKKNDLSPALQEKLDREEIDKEKNLNLYKPNDLTNILLNILVGFLNYVVPILLIASSAFFTETGEYGMAVGLFGLFLYSLRDYNL